ncbi:penicillin-binding transpeptidase domain-containing protein [Paenibacillus motobuensis]|uniref:penicillin-binding transpeptidase domain-containing protein n=1 Tax=Paenibacillus TaxID=44249 RepID=UPI00203B0516|nr:MULTISPECIES: penicillin-binding transpeptidase domain-containing protein [Paenibacillus]MCM3040469.1 penicillin-binding transpeptidase domain-containing protein [Paenibacillus lutimineralis]MCM3647573.1 penicillin-binding transpeptidase domain-containing protein [Paenibacillus motobuensis]
MIKRIKLRTLLIGGIITLFFAVLMLRVFWVQVVESNFWQSYAENQWSKKKVLTATRGTITDRNGDVLAVDAPAYTVAVNPQIINKYELQEEVVQGLHQLLNKDEGELRKLVNAKRDNGSFYPQREVRNEGWKIDQELRDQVEKFSSELKEKHKIPDSGILLLKESKRYYPKNSLAAHVLGYTDREEKAVSGIEAAYDTELTGQDGAIEYKSDGRGIEIPKASEIYTPAKDGKDIRLTIDDTIQYYIEDAMIEAFNQLRPISMTVIAADPKTMEILGMANLPSYNPNEYWVDVDQKNFYNHAIKSVYEPGSTFKIVTLAATVQEGLFNPDGYYMTGSIRVPGQTIHDIRRSGWGSISYLEGVKRSSNVAFVKLGYEMLGPDLMKQYVDNFGFGQATGIELPGEAKGVVSPEQQADYAAMTYGHGKLLVTPLQQVAAVAAIANGGKLMTPHIVKSITDPLTGETTVTKPEVVKQVISQESAKKTGEYLEQVVSDLKIGSGRHAYIDGYRIAGKTGTAVKVINGKYDYKKQVLSFIGYAPVDDPKIAMLVLIDEPQDSDLGGGTAAAPIFKKIMNQTLQYLGVPKKFDNKTTSDIANNGIKAPDLKDLSVQEAKNKLAGLGINYATLGKGTKIVSQFPKAGSVLKTGQHMYLLSEEGDKVNIPNLKGQSLRDAMELLSAIGVEVNIEGEGYVVSQTLTKENGKRRIDLVLEPLIKEDEESGQDEQNDQAAHEENAGESSGSSP